MNMIRVFSNLQHVLISSNPIQLKLKTMTDVPNLINKSMDWFLYNRDLRHEKVKFDVNITNS